MWMLPSMKILLLRWRKKDLIFRGALATRNVRGAHDSSLPQAILGPPTVLEDTADASSPWTPYTALAPEHPADDIETTSAFTDTFVSEESPAEEARATAVEEIEDDDDDDSSVPDLIPRVAADYDSDDEDEEAVEPAELINPEAAPIDREGAQLNTQRMGLTESPTEFPSTGRRRIPNPRTFLFSHAFG